jgi:hypothetical protein
LLEEIHPGEILLEDFMKPMGISARQLAADIEIGSCAPSSRQGSASFSRLRRDRPLSVLRAIAAWEPSRGRYQACAGLH